MTPSVIDWALSSSAFPPMVESEASEYINGSESMEEDTDSEACKLYSFITSTLIIGVLCGLGLVGNTVSFFVFVKDSIKTSTLFLFQGLCVIDNLLLLTVFPVYCIEPFVRYTGLYTSYLNQGYFIVLIYIFPLASVSQTATIWVTVLVGINRYIAVCKPYQAVRLCTVRQARIQLAVVLIFSVLYNVTRFAEGCLEFKNGTAIDAYQTELGKSKLYIFIYDNILYMVFMLILPLLVLTILNIRLVKALKKLSRKRAEMQSASQRQDNNVTLVLIIVIIVFIVCQTPALANRFMWSVLDDGARDCGGVQFFFSRLSNLLVITNSAVNFVIYFLFNTRFRQILVQGLGYSATGSHGQSSYSAVRSSQTTTSNSVNHAQLNPTREADANPNTATL